MVESAPHTPERTFSDELRELIDNRNMLTEKTKNKVIFDLQREQIEKEARRLNMQCKTISEIVSSERKYLTQLETVLKFFRGPLEEAFSNTPSNKLFLNIETILNLNKVLLDEMVADLHPMNIAKAFLNVAPFLKMYTNYTNDYKRTIFAIQELRRDNQRLHDVITRQESRPEVGDRINSLLIVPIQRVPRYRLLLRELLEHTVPNSEEYIKVSEALWKIEEVTKYINSQVKEQDNLLRLMQIQQSLTGGKPNILLPGRWLIKEGVLMKVANDDDKGKPRHFILMSDTIMCCKMKADSLHCTHLLSLKKCNVELVLGRSVFSLTGPGCNLLLYSNDDYLLSYEWVESIKNAKMKYEERMETLQKISSRPSLHSCISSANDTFEYPSAPNTRKRKHSEGDAEGSCLPNVRQKIAKLADLGQFTSTQKLVQGENTEKAMEQLETRSGYFKTFKRLLSRITNWF